MSHDQVSTVRHYRDTDLRANGTFKAVVTGAGPVTLQLFRLAEWQRVDADWHYSGHRFTPSASRMSWELVESAAGITTVDDAFTLAESWMPDTAGEASPSVSDDENDAAPAGDDVDVDGVSRVVTVAMARDDWEANPHLPPAVLATLLAMEPWQVGAALDAALAEYEDIWLNLLDHVVEMATHTLLGDQ